MSESMNENDRQPAEDAVPQETPAPAAPVRLRVVPAIIIVAAHGIGFAFTWYLPTVIGNAIGIVGLPILTVLLLTIWWLGFSRVPWRDRFIGLGAFIAVAAWSIVSQPQYGGRILSVSFPVLTTGIVLILAATMWLTWREQRFKVILYLIACAIIFPMFRIDDVAGNLWPIMSWRWSATSDALVAESSAPGGKADLPAQVGPLDWPGFRGPARDGVLRGTTIATNWNEKPLKELWRKRVGLGFSSFAAVANYVFTQEQRKDKEVVVCYRADTGAEVWVNALEVRFDEAVGSGPRATPQYDAGKLYTQGATGILQCLDAATGAQIWKKDIAADTSANTPQWGFSSSPLVTDKLVITFAGGANNQAVIAYDKVTGTKAWCGGASSSGYSSAQLSTIGDTPQIVMTSGFGVQAFEPATGALLWENEWRTKMNPRVVQPAVIDGKAVLVGTAEGKGTRYIDVAPAEGGWKATEKWTSTEFRPYFNDYALHRGYCYGFDGDVLVCVDSHTGKQRWKGPHCGGQVLLVENSDAVIVLTEKGKLLVVRANPNSYEELASFQAVKGKTWNHPVIANGKLFVRNAEEAACFEIPVQ